MTRKTKRVVMKRIEFENLNFTILKRISVVLQKAMNEAGLALVDVHSVEVVGEGSRMPAIMSRVNDFFGKKPSQTMIESDPVATGCFIDCAMFYLSSKLPKFQIIDILPYSVELDDMAEKQVVFPKGSPMPSIKKVMFLRSSTFFLDLLYINADDSEGSSEMISYLIGPFQSCEGQMEVNVTVQLDLSGISCIESATMGDTNLPVVEYSCAASRAKHFGNLTQEDIKTIFRDKVQKAEKELIDTSMQSYINMEIKRRTEIEKTFEVERNKQKQLEELVTAVQLELMQSKATLNTTIKLHEQQETTLPDEIQKSRKELVNHSNQLQSTMHSLANETNNRIELERCLVISRASESALERQLLDLRNSLDIETVQKIELEIKLADSKALLEASKKEKEGLRIERNHALQERDDASKQRDNGYSVIAREMSLADEYRSALEQEVAQLRRIIEYGSSTPGVNFTMFSHSDLKEATKNFDESREIGKGGYGSVYKGFLPLTPVAIKILNKESLQGTTEFNQEVEILSKVRHPNIIRLLGACSEVQALVYEYVPNGSLEAYLNKMDCTKTLNWQNRIRIAFEICSALIYLHSMEPHGIAHGDLKPENVLLGLNSVSKLGDFGICRQLYKNNETLTPHRLTLNPKGTFAYMDPDYLTTGKMTPQYDVYSFGIILLQFITGRNPMGIRPYVEMAENDGRAIIDTSAGDWPSDEAKTMILLGLQCSDPIRKNRPDLATHVRCVIQSMKNNAGIA